MKTKYLLFQNAANDCMAYPLNRLKDIEGVSGDVVFTFDATSSFTTVTVSTSDEFQAIKDVEIHSHFEGLVTECTSIT